MVEATPRNLVNGDTTMKHRFKISLVMLLKDEAVENLFNR